VGASKNPAGPDTVPGVLSFHEPKRWIALVAKRLRGVGCSDEYVEEFRLSAEKREWRKP
jgi:hypothetical protein